jgi:PAS domain S-box-containing protein
MPEIDILFLKSSKAKRRIVIALLAIVLISSSCAFVQELLVGPAIYPFHMFHAVLDSVGAVAALIMGLVVMLARGQEKSAFGKSVIAGGLMSMGLFDIAHILSLNTQLFLLFYSLSLFFGGVLFGFYWLIPRRLFFNSGNLFFVFNLILTLALIALFTFSPQLTPIMRSGTSYSPLTLFLNIGGGLSFLIASFRYARAYIATQHERHFIFANICLLFGITGLLFVSVQDWEVEWWYWHFIHVAAYLIMLINLFIYIQRNRNSLLRARIELTDLVEQRTYALQEENRKLQSADKEMEKMIDSLRSSEERWAFALEGSGVGVWDWDVQTNTVKFSQQWKEMLGYPDDQISDQFYEWTSRIHPDDIDSVMRDLHNVLDGQTSIYVNEHQVLCKDGSYLWVLDRAMAVRSDDRGRALRMVGTYTDISHHKKIDRLKSEFIATVSHELRTPVTSMRGSLGLLEAGVLGELPTRAMDMVRLANKNCQRLIRLVDDILDMDQLMSDSMHFELRSLNLIDVVQQSLEENYPFALSFQVQLKFTPPDYPCMVDGDEGRLHQILTNLLSNAVKFSQAGDVVQIRIIELDLVLKIEVEDSGSGIPVGFQKRIFEAFAQADGSDTRRQGGTGLGLKISKRLIEAMNGNIGFTSTVGQGSLFWITLPKQVPREALLQAQFFK